MHMITSCPWPWAHQKALNAPSPDHQLALLARHSIVGRAHHQLFFADSAGSIQRIAVPAAPCTPADVACRRTENGGDLERSPIVAPAITLQCRPRRLIVLLWRAQLVQFRRRHKDGRPCRCNRCFRCRNATRWRCRRTQQRLGGAYAAMVRSIAYPNMAIKLFPP